MTKSKKRIKNTSITLPNTSENTIFVRSMHAVISILKNRSNYKWLFWIWLAIIIIASSIPNINAANISLTGNKLEIRLDYILHLVIYFILALLFINWKYISINSSPLLYLSLTITIGLVLSFLEELHQLIIPGRTFNLIDFYYNATGLLIGVFTTYFYLHQRSS